VSATARNLLTPPPENSRPPIKRLTRRESAVLRLLIEGSTNKEIANETESTEAAVKGIVQQLFHKTGTRMRSQLLRIALERYRDQL
jgi:two-component system, NarL family, nitrate/nitrite response regulator NarL